MGSDTRPRRKVSRLRYAASLVALALVALVFTAFALGHIGNYEVISNSMAPTLLKGDRVLVDQRPYYVPSVGDVVALEDPEAPGSLLTKRVAAVGGQTVEIVDGYVVVDGRRWAPPGRKPSQVSPESRLNKVKLGEGEIFVLGDNSGNSEDSLFFGPVPASSVRGKVLFIYWPPGRVGKVR